MQFISKKNIVFIVSGLLALGVAIYAAQWKWHFWRPATNQVAGVNPMLEASPPEYENDMPDNGMAVKEVLSAHLFGQEEFAKKVSADAVPKTQQPLELRGIVFIPHHPERGVALIAQVGGMAKDYKTGDNIEPLPDWKVLEILPDSVRIGAEEPGEKLDLLPGTAQASGSQSAIPTTSQVGMEPPPANLPPQANNPDQDNEPAQENPPPPGENLPPPEAASPPSPISTPPVLNPTAAAKDDE